MTIRYPGSSVHHHQQKGSIKINQSFGQDAKADVILKYSADEARNLKSYGETIVMFVGLESCAFLLWSESLQVIMSWLLSHSSGEFPESVKINETVDFVGGYFVE